MMLPSFNATRDIHQDYLMGLALQHGQDPYQPIPKLWNDYLHSPYTGGLRHPSPHLPVMAAIFLPLSYLPFWSVSLLWFLGSVLAVWCGIGLLLKALDSKLEYRPALFAIFALSVAGRHELLMGQVNSILFLFLALTYLFVRSGRDWISGLFLGLTLALKLFGIPILIFLLLKGKLNSVTSALATFLLVTSLVSLLSGGTILNSYIEQSLPTSSKLYTGHLANLSAENILTRLVTNYHASKNEGGNIQVALSNDPKDSSDGSPMLYSAIFGGIIIVLILTCTLQVEFEAGFHKALILSCIASPVAWTHYLVALLVTVIYLTVQLAKSTTYSFISKELFVIMLLLVPMIFDPGLIGLSIFGWLNAPSIDILVPFWVNLLYLASTLSLLTSSWFLSRVR